MSLTTILLVVLILVLELARPGIVSAQWLGVTLRAPSPSGQRRGPRQRVAGASPRIPLSIGL